MGCMFSWASFKMVPYAYRVYAKFASNACVYENVNICVTMVQMFANVMRHFFIILKYLFYYMWKDVSHSPIFLCCLCLG